MGFIDGATHAGLDFGLAGGVGVGLWHQLPENLEGPYIGYSLEVGEGFGGGITVLWTLPDFEPVGFLVVGGPSVEANISGVAGATLVFYEKVPDNVDTSGLATAL